MSLPHNMYCSRRCVTADRSAAMLALRGIGACRPKAIGETTQRKDGYLLERTPDGWKSQHRLVIERQLGRKLSKHEEVHHIDGNRANNALANLEVWVHATYHYRGIKLDQGTGLIPFQHD